MSFELANGLYRRAGGSTGAGGQALDFNFTETGERIGPCNYAAVRDPTSGDDSTVGFSKGSRWINNSTLAIFDCVSATPGSAIWNPTQATPIDPDLVAIGALTGLGYLRRTGLNAWSLGDIIPPSEGGTGTNDLGNDGNILINRTGHIAGSTTAYIDDSIASLIIDGVPVTNRSIRFRSNNLDRWSFTTDNTPESDPQSGSNLLINRYANDGSYIDTPLQVNRGNGHVLINNDLYLNNSNRLFVGDSDPGGTRLSVQSNQTGTPVAIASNALAAAGILLLLGITNPITGDAFASQATGNVSGDYVHQIHNTGDGRAIFDMTADGDGDSLIRLRTQFQTWTAGVDRSQNDQFVISASPFLGVNNFLTIDYSNSQTVFNSVDTSFQGTASVNQSNARDRYFQVQTDNSRRWSFGSPTSAEPGANVGSDFVINRYDDTGLPVDSPFTITRSNANITLNSNVVSIGSGSIPSTGLLRVGGAITGSGVVASSNTNSLSAGIVQTINDSGYLTEIVQYGTSNGGTLAGMSTNNLGLLYSQSTSGLLIETASNVPVWIATGDVKRAQFDATGLTVTGAGTFSGTLSAQALTTTSNNWVYLGGNVGGFYPTLSALTKLAVGWNRSGGEGETVIAWDPTTGSTPRLSFVTWDATAGAPGYVEQAWIKGQEVHAVGNLSAGGTVTAGSFVQTNGPNSALYFIDRSTSRGWGWYGHGDTAALYNGSADILTVSPAGLLTAATITATNQLMVGTTDTTLGTVAVAATNPYLALNSAAGKQSNVLYYDNSVLRWLVGCNYSNVGDGNLFFVRNTGSGNILLAPDGNGRVIIGTATDDGVNRLQVSGGISGTTGTFSDTVILNKNTNSQLYLQVVNPNAGSSAAANFLATNNSGLSTEIGIGSSGASAYGSLGPNTSYLYSNSSAGLIIMADDAAGTISFSPGGHNARWTMAAAGHILPSASANFDIGSGGQQVRNIYSGGFVGGGFTGTTAAFSGAVTGASYSGGAISGTSLTGTGVLIMGSGPTTVTTAAGLVRLAAMETGTNGYVLTMVSGVPVWAAATGGGSGTVTSVGLSVPGEFSVGGTNPVTGSGTLALSWNNVSANYALRGPTTGGAAAPTFRLPVKADHVSSTVYGDAPSTWTFTTSGSSGHLYGMWLANTYVPTGTASSTDIFIDRTTSGSSSGSHNFIRMDAGGTTLARVDSSGYFSGQGYNIEGGGTGQTTNVTISGTTLHFTGGILTSVT